MDKYFSIQGSPLDDPGMARRQWEAAASVARVFAVAADYVV